MNISFHYLEKPLQDFDQLQASTWIKDVIEKEKKQVGTITVIFCNDEYLMEMNQKYLEHDTFTDIITFDYSNGSSEISGDLFISTERVAENAIQLGVLFDEELHRVIIHGVLHLIGYNDKEREDIKRMRRKEDYYLQRRL